MKANIKNRLNEIETIQTDWAAQLDFVDYIGLEDYEDGNWEELHHDQFITVVRNIHTGKVHGVYNDRRSDAEIMATVGSLAYL